MTGSYNNNFMIYPSDPDKEIEVVLQADKSAFKAKKVGIPTPINGKKQQGSRAGSPAAGGPGARMRKETDADQIDFNKKILHMSWHPFEDSIAIAATNNVSHENLPVSSNCGDADPNSCLCSRRCRWIIDAGQRAGKTRCMCVCACMWGGGRRRLLCLVVFCVWSFYCSRQNTHRCYLRNLTYVPKF